MDTVVVLKDKNNNIREIIHNKIDAIIRKNV